MSIRVGVVRQMPLREPPGLGYGFSIGRRYTHTLVFPTQDEARAARKRLMDAYGAAVEVVERWSPDERR